MESCLATNQGSRDPKQKEMLPAFILLACLCKQQPAAEVGKAGGDENQTEYAKICRMLLTFPCLLTTVLRTHTQRNTHREHKILHVSGTFIFSLSLICQQAGTFSTALLYFLAFTFCF